MVNAYNKALSEKANDVDYFADAYLKILGPKVQNDDIKFIRDNRVVNFEGEDSQKIIVDFMGKPESDTSQENLLNRLERLIFHISMVANISDENFGTNSGIALKYKLQAMSNLEKTKERKFTSGMNRRYKLLFSHPSSKVPSDAWMQLGYHYTPNIPANLLEEAQIAAQMEGITSHETQLKVLSIVENVKAELEKIEEENKAPEESIIDRIFIAGVAPITLDSITSGFNIARDITKNIGFNDMLGFSKEDVKYLMNELEINENTQKELLPIIKINYDGYVFSNIIKENIEKYKIYNSNMTLYFLSSYIELNEVPEQLVDTNIISDYGKIEAFMDLCQNMNKIEILEKIVSGELIESELTEKFNAEINFGEKELISLLYYLGYLTIKENEFGILKFGSPNDVIKKIYSEYFLEYIKRRAGIQQELKEGDMTKGILLEGKIDKAIGVLG